MAISAVIFLRADAPRQQGAQAQMQGAVERGERLVEQHQLGLDGEGPRQRGAAREAERQLPRIIAAAPVQFEGGEQIAQARVGQLRRGEAEIVGDTAPGQQARLLEGHADAFRERL